MAVNLYQPPDKWYNKDVSDIPLVFLAGPIQGAKNWQDEAINYFKQEDKIFDIANPRQQQLSENFDFVHQVEWEVYHMRMASSVGVLMFWLAKEDVHTCERAYGQTSRFELAEWLQNQKFRKIFQPDRTELKLVLGIEEGFSGEKYIKHRISQDLPLLEIHSTLKDTCDAVIKMV